SSPGVELAEGSCLDQGPIEAARCVVDPDRTMREDSLRAIVLALLVALAGALPARADDQADDLAKKISNPIASLISVPLQLNYDCCYGLNDGNRVTLNVQPVIPFKLDKDLTLIVRTIVPIVDMGETVHGAGSHFGIGDTTQSFFLSPTPDPGGWIWGV